MSNARTNYATISAVDYRGEHVLSSYNLSITPLTFFANIPTQTGDDSLTLNNTEVTFDYGDGSIEEATSIYTVDGNNILSSSHTFDFPGVYTVRMVLRDCNNNAILASDSKDIQIEDYITNTFTVTCLDLDPDYHLTLSAGEYSTPLTINSQSPFYQDFQSIYFSVSNTNCPNYFNLNDSKFKQLQNYFSFYKRDFIHNLTAFEYVEVKNIALSSQNLYVKLSGDVLVTSTTSSTSSVVAGTSGTQVVYFKTEQQDTVPAGGTEPVYLNFYKDRKNIYSRGKNGYSNNDYLNNFTVSMSSHVGNASLQSPDHISITSNGLDNEGEEINSFQLSPVQYKNTYIPFILKPKNFNQFTMKSLTSDTPEFVLINNGSSLLPLGAGAINPGSIVDSKFYTIDSLGDTLSSIGTDFWYRGYLYFDDSFFAMTSAVVMNVTLSSNCVYTDSRSSDIYSLSGGSSFRLYPKDYYSLYKINEDFDFEQMIKDLRFQEFLLDDNVFFTDFIGSIFGGVSSKEHSLGKTIYESIINFVQNTSDVDVCEIDALDGMSKLVSNQNLIYESNQPPAIKRLINLFSVQYNKFRGYENQFSQNFDSRNRTTKETYGTNLGDEINFLTYIISAGTDIVAYEKFSGTYTQLNTYQPLSLSGALSAVQNEIPGTFPFGVNGFGDNGAITYRLSTYNELWGWPLVLRNSLVTSQTALDGTDIPYGPDPPGLKGIPQFTNLSALSAEATHFYDFYEYTPGGNNTVLNNTVDWSNPQTGVIDTPYPTGAAGEPTHSLGSIPLDYNTGLSGLEGDNNIFDIMIRDTLFDSLSLFQPLTAQS
jgi:hypothetical protein